MNFLKDRNTKLVLVALTVVGALLLLNMHSKKLGKQVALLGSVVALLVGIVSVHMVMNQPKQMAEGFEEHDDEPVVSQNVVAENVVTEAVVAEPTETVVAEEPKEVEDVLPHDMSNSAPSPAPAGMDNGALAGCLPRDVLNPQDLLPSANSPNTWDTPSNPGGIEGPNFLNPEHLVGINTVGQSLRNANRQLRSEPPNPQVKVSPWLQSTIEPDTNRRPLEIGGCE
jgi:hypothetical protein